MDFKKPGDLERSRKVYQQLGLRDFAPMDEIKKSYRELALLHHPDKNQSDPDAVNRFRLINEAYQVLSDETKRKRYDDMLKSAQAAMSGIIPSAFNAPSAAAPMRGFTREATASAAAYSAGGYSAADAFGGAAASPTSSPTDFGASMGYKAKVQRRPPSSQRGGAANQSAGGSATLGSPDRASYSAGQNEEFRKKEKARFAEMKRRIENERTAAAEAEKARLIKVQHDQRREEQRRKREQERLRERLDHAIGRQPTSTSGATVTTPLQSTPLARASSSTNVGGVTYFRSSSAVNTGLSQSSNRGGGGGGGGRGGAGGGMMAPRSTSAGAGVSSPIRGFSASRGIRNDDDVVSPSATHVHSKHGTFMMRPTAVSPIASTPPPKFRDTAAATAAETNKFLDDLKEQSQSPKRRALGKFASASPRRDFGKENGDGGDLEGELSMPGSPEMMTVARQQIAKDIDNLPVEEHEEREHFLRLQERHERALLISVFKQEAFDIDNELRFRGLRDDEFEQRSNITNAEAVERSCWAIEHQCVRHREDLLREAYRISHGLAAWHDNVWTHLQQDVQRRVLLAEREQLVRSAVVVEEEQREFSRLTMEGTMLNIKFRVGLKDEAEARNKLYQWFYNGANAIEATRRWLAQRAPVVEHEEMIERARLGIELQHTWARGELAQQYAEAHEEIREARRTALATYISKLQTEMSQIRVKLLTHNNIVAGLEAKIELEKKNAADEREDAEARMSVLRATIGALESTVEKLRADLLESEEKRADAVSKIEHLKEDASDEQKKAENLRDNMRAQADADIAELKQAHEEQSAEAKRELEAERQKTTDLQERHDKLRAKAVETIAYLKETKANEARQRDEIAELRREVARLRELREEDASAFGIADDSSPPSKAPSPSVRYADPSGGATGAAALAGAASSTTAAGNAQQRESTSQSPSPSRGWGLVKSRLVPPKGGAGAASKAPATKPSSSTGSNSSAPATPSKQQQAPAAGAASGGAKTSTPASTPTATAGSKTSNDTGSAAERTLAARHNRTMRLENRLYTAAAAASAASVVIAQRESAAHTSPIVKTPTTSGSASTQSTPAKQQQQRHQPQQQQQQQQQHQQQQQQQQRPPLSPAPTPTTFTPSKLQQQQLRDSEADAASSANSSPSRMSYRETHNQAHPQALKPKSEFEQDDTAAVAQREAVAAFLQKQHGSIVGSTDDPQSARITVGNVAGKGLVEYARTTTTTAPQSPSSPSECASCDMNTEAISRLATTTDKLLSRNAALVEDNTLLARAVVSMNDHRQASAAVADASSSAISVATASP